MLDRVRQRLEAARAERMAATLDTVDGEEVDLATSTLRPDGLAFVTSFRFVVHDYAAMREVSVPWDAITRADVGPADLGVARVRLWLDAPDGEPDEVDVEVPERLADALRARLG